jgi:hypothetical protein
MSQRQICFFGIIMKFGQTYIFCFDKRNKYNKFLLQFQQNIILNNGQYMSPRISWEKLTTKYNVCVW